MGDSSVMDRAAPWTKRILFLLQWRRRGRDDRLHGRRFDGRLRGLFDNDRLVDHDRLRFRRNDRRRGLRRMLRNYVRCGLGESSDLASQLQKLAMQSIVLLRRLVGNFLNPEAEPPLAHNRGDGQDRSG